MTEIVYKPFFCRRCLNFEENALARCKVCETTSIPAPTVTHPELFDLSIAHLDCDAFYAAIEKRDDPSLADRPVIVGGGRRGVVTTCCYIARTYGVRSAMPMFKALAACPDAVVIRPDFEKYLTAGQTIRTMMRALTPLVEPLSIDEAFMDLSGTARMHGEPPAVTMARLQQAVAEEVGVTVSVGLSHNKFLAKIASDFDKPSGYFVIGRAETKCFLAAQPISLIWGIGRKTTARLAGDGLYTIAQLQAMDAKTLAARYGETGLRLARLAHGDDSRSVSPHRDTKSVSAETTFNDDISAYRSLEDRLWPLCEKVSRRMKAKGFAGRVVTLKLKTAAFKTITRRRTLEEPSNLARVLFDTGCSMLTGECDGRSFRLIGIGYAELGNAGDGASQRGFFGTDNDRLARREAAIDALREKFGDSAIGPGRVFKGK
ncbi:MAG: DNA polymerase IV [Pseudomonadota bacterium]